MSQKKKTDHSSDQASAVCYKAAMPALQILCCKESDQPRQPWCFVQQKTSCRIMGVVPQPCSEWEVERVLRAAAKAPMQGSCSYSASWRHMCCACCTWRSSCACSRRASPGSCSSRVVCSLPGRFDKKQFYFLHNGILVVARCFHKLRVKRRHPPPAARPCSHHGQSPSCSECVALLKFQGAFGKQLV